MFFLNLSLIVFIAGAVYLFTVDSVHNRWLSNQNNQCGPFKNETSFSTAIEIAIRAKKTFWTTLYIAFMQWPTTIFVLMLIIWHITQTKTIEIMQERFLNDKISEL